jgi:hypothetical protein
MLGYDDPLSMAHAFVLCIHTVTRVRMRRHATVGSTCRSLFELFRWCSTLDHSTDSPIRKFSEWIKSKPEVQRRQGSQCRNHYLVCRTRSKGHSRYGHAVSYQTDPRYMCQRIRSQTHARATNSSRSLKPYFKSYRIF